jgi:cellulose synthase/poly-beta-1,6-N-acetylglucosamine synthase-like glycosyltransferase
MGGGMTLFDLVTASEWFFLLYFVGLTSIYLLLNLVSFSVISRNMLYQDIDEGVSLYTGFEFPISLLAPAYNEEATIASSVHSLLQLSYPEYEIIVINDGSKDATLDVLVKEFSLQPIPEAYRIQIPTQPVKTIYRSTRYHNLRVVDKENGGKADALNAGINCARYPLFCGMDADSILPRDSLLRIVRPFQEDPDTVAVGGIVRIVNGCEVHDGHLINTALPRNWLALFQIIEYLRAFLFGRMGWQPLNAVLIISGAFGLFRKEAVIAVGGYRHDTMGEDMELVVRMHRIFSEQRRPYRIHFIPDPICWTEAPEDLRTLKNQRIRWQRGLAESLWLNKSMMFAKNSGAAGWLAFPFMFFFEMLGPLLELTGLIMMIAAYYFGLIDYHAAIAMLILAFGMGFLLSGSALLLEEMSYRIYRRPCDLCILCLALIVENFGYRQLNSYWRLLGMLRWLFKSKSTWGAMKRTAKWNTGKAKSP